MYKLCNPVAALAAATLLLAAAPAAQAQDKVKFAYLKTVVMLPFFYAE